MPTISQFHGITIRMYSNDHAPPHFHASYAEFEAKIGMASMECLSGDLPSAQMRMVLMWARARRAELEENWHLARHEGQLRWIEPL